MPERNACLSIRNDRRKAIPLPFLNDTWGEIVPLARRAPANYLLRLCTYNYTQRV